MDPLVVLPLLVLIAVVFVLVPVGLGAWSRFRREKVVPCPVTGREAAVHVDRAVCAELLGRRSMRRISACSLWRADAVRCREGCLDLPDEAMSEARAS